MNITSTRQIRRWRAFAVLAVSFFMTIVDLTIVNVALPTIGRELHFSESNLQWVVTAYAITFGGLLLLGGRAADLLGRRRILMLGLVVFTAASLGAGLATSAGVLIVMRGLQGLGAAIVLPAALSIVMKITPEAVPGRCLTSGRAAHPLYRLGIHLLPQRANRYRCAAARSAYRARESAPRCPPPLRPAGRSHRDRVAAAPRLRSFDGA